MRKAAAGMAPMKPTAIGPVSAARAGFGLMWWLAILLLLAGCTGAQERNPVPPGQIELAELPGIPDARFWGDAPPADIARRLTELRSASHYRPNLWVKRLTGGARRVCACSRQSALLHSAPRWPSSGDAAPGGTRRLQGAGNASVLCSPPPRGAQVLSKSTA